MLPRNHPDHIQISFDDHRLVDNAGLILPATLAQHLGLPQLVDRRLDLGDAPGRQHGRQDDDPGGLRPRFRGGRVWLAATAATTPTRCALAGQLGFWAVWSRRHRPWGRSCADSGGATVRQLDRVGRELLSRAWAAGAGPGDEPLTIDLDSTLDGRRRRCGRDHLHSLPE